MFDSKNLCVVSTDSLEKVLDTTKVQLYPCFSQIPLLCYCHKLLPCSISCSFYPSGVGLLLRKNHSCPSSACSVSAHQ